MIREKREAINMVVDDFEQLTKIVAEEARQPAVWEKVVAALLTVAVQVENLRRESAKI